MTQINCDHCGKPFEAKRSTATFCSVRCRVASHRRTETQPKPMPDPVWCDKAPTLKGERLDIATQAAAIVASYAGKVTLRQVYYRLVAANVIPNTEQSYKRLGDIVVDARKAGIIPWAAMEDRGRSIAAAMVAPSLQSHRELMRRLYDEDRWTTQGQRIAVIVEKAALAGVIEPVCRRWQVPFLAARGYASATVVAEASVRLRNHCVLYLGDHDPSGVDMGNDWQKRLSGFAAGCYVSRIALTREQIDEFNLPPQPVKAGDARAAGYRAAHGDGVWELDAMPPDELERLVDARIMSFVDMDAWRQRADEVERNRGRL